MAFASSNIRKGTCGDLKLTAGQWTGSVGDTTGTITVEGGVVYMAKFVLNVANGPTQIVPVSVSYSGQVATVSVYNKQTVTDGTFLIISA